MNFFETPMGHKFFQSQLPQLTNALQDIASALSNPKQEIHLQSDIEDKDFLHRLYNSLYESESLRQNSQTNALNFDLVTAEKQLRQLLSQSKQIESFEKYLEIASKREAVIMELSYRSGYCTAVQMLLSGNSIHLDEKNYQGKDT